MDARIKAGKQTRFLLVWISLFIWLGIVFTGFANTHWVLIALAGWLAFAGFSGICPGMFLARLIFKEE